MPALSSPRAPSSTITVRVRRAVIVVMLGMAPVSPAHGQAAPGSAATTFRAVGNEPGWTLDIGGGRLSLVADYGATKVDAPLPAPIQLEAAKRYLAKAADGRSLDVTLIETICADTMTGMPRPITVEVVLDGRTLKGCGGEPTSLLRGKTWVVEDISGRGVLAPSRFTLVFGQSGRLTGTGACNPYSASYLLSGEGLSVTMPISGMRSCAPPQMAQEAQFLEVLRGVQRFEITKERALRLHAADGGSITARAEDPVQAALEKEAAKKRKK